MWVLMLQAAEEWGQPPWVVEEQASEMWWGRWRCWKEEKIAFQAKKDASGAGGAGEKS